MSKIKNAYHDEICKLRETDDPYDKDWVTEETKWKQNMYRHKDALKWLESILRKNREYQKGDKK